MKHQTGDIVKIIKVSYPFFKKSDLGKISKLIIKENGKYYLEDLNVYASSEILTTDLNHRIDHDNCSIILEKKDIKMVTINDSIKSFINEVENGVDHGEKFEKYVQMYGEDLLYLIENKNHPKWIEAFEIIKSEKKS